MLVFQTNDLLQEAANEASAKLWPERDQILHLDFTDF